MKVTRIIAAAAMSAVLAGTAQAQVNCTGSSSAHMQNCTATNQVSASVPYVARIQISAPTTTLTMPTAENFETTEGVSDANAVSLSVKANAGYKITASAATANWLGGSGSKEVSDLSITTDNFANKSALSSTGTVAIATANAPTGGTTYNIGYNVKYNWLTDTPGTYTLTVNYTLTAP